MQKSRLSQALSLFVLALTACAFPWTAVGVHQIDSPKLVASNPLQGTWEDRVREAIRRLREAGGFPPRPPKPVKAEVEELRADFDSTGLAPGLTAADLFQVETEATTLMNCAELEEKPPAGTDYALVVSIHNLGKEILNAAINY